MIIRISSFFFIVGSLCALFPITTAFSWRSTPGKTQRLTLPHTKSITLRWEWSLISDEKFTSLFVYRSNSKSMTITKVSNSDHSIARFYRVSNITNIDPSYRVKFDGKKKSNGFVEVTIVDVINQGSNVDVMSNDYVYWVSLTIYPNPQPTNDFTTVIVSKLPTVSITTNPTELKYVTQDTKVTLTCAATEGKPTPTIKWYITQVGSGATTTQNLDNPLEFDTFTRDKAGIYNCTATNTAGSSSKIWLLQYTGCDAGCTSDDKIAIELTGLTYDEQYSNSQSQKYKDLKVKIEEECMKLYASSSQYNIYSCEVLNFRKGSVVANMKITYPDSNQNKNMRQPLIDQLATGTFAEMPVNKGFVSPTSPPTQTTQQEKTTVGSNIGGPDSGARADSGGGLSTGAIVAIVVVFSIIFIVIIIVLVVFMLKRKKPASRNNYAEDSEKNKSSSSPLKSQPYKDPSYDNDNPKDIVYADLNFQDRYNGGIPPPQYTAADYAEVRPSQPQPNDSNMEWDKDIDEKNEMWI